MDYTKQEIEQKLEECTKQRAEVVRSLQTLANNVQGPEAFRYYETINDLRYIVDDLDDIRETELDLLSMLNTHNYK